MNLQQFMAALCSNNAKMHIVQGSNRVMKFGMKVLKCTNAEQVVANFKIVDDEIDKSSKWTAKSKPMYIKAFTRAVESIPSLRAKIPNGMLGKSSYKRKRVLIVDTDTEDDEVAQVLHKKVKLPSTKATITFFELKVQNTNWKLCFKKEQDDIVIHHNSSMKVKFNINETEKIKNYLVRVVEMMFREACKVNVDVKSSLTYDGNTLYECKINNVVRNIRDAANYAWQEMIVPFYDITTM